MIVTPSVDIALLLTTKPEAALPVNNVDPDTVPVIEVLATVTLVVPDVIAVVDIEPNWSSTYFLLANCASADGAVVLSVTIFSTSKICAPETYIFPVPAGLIIMCSFDLDPVILLSLIVKPSVVKFPVTSPVTLPVKLPVTFIVIGFAISMFMLPELVTGVFVIVKSFPDVVSPTDVTVPEPTDAAVTLPLPSKLKTLLALSDADGIVNVAVSVCGSATESAWFSILFVASITACDKRSNSAFTVSAKKAPDCVKSVVLARFVSLTSVITVLSLGADTNTTDPVPDVPESNEIV